MRKLTAGAQVAAATRGHNCQCRPPSLGFRGTPSPMSDLGKWSGEVGGEEREREVGKEEI
jgi:hypothetical protein